MRHESDMYLYLYTEMVYGKGKVDEVGYYVKSHGGTRVMLVYGGKSVKANGVLDRVKASCEKEGLFVLEYPGVQPNPRRSHVEAGAKLADEYNIDYFVGIGGGSPIDSAKAISVCRTYKGDDWYGDTFTRRVKVSEIQPVGCVCTIAAAGAESSTSIMVMDDIERMDKFGGGGNLARCQFCILDPETTFTVPPFQTAAGSADIFAHSIERYFYAAADCALGDGFAVALMKDVVKYTLTAIKEPTNYEARAELMLCGTFSQNDITNIGKIGYQRGGPHYYEGVLSGHFNTTHGAGLAVVMPAWLEYCVNFSDEACRRVAQFGIEVFGVKADLYDLRAVALEGIEKFREWLKSIGMPSTLHELLGREVTEEDIDIMMTHPHFGEDGKHVAYVTMTREQMRNFYRSIL